MSRGLYLIIMASEVKCVGRMILLYLPCFTWFFLLYVFIKLLSQFSLTSHSGLWRKLACATFKWHFPKLLVQQFNMLLCFQSKIKFVRLFWLFMLIYFYFLLLLLLLLPFYFLKWNHFFSTFIPVFCESHHYFSYLLPREVCTNL